VQNRKKKVLFLATVYRHLANFHLHDMKMLQQRGIEVHAAASPDLGGRECLSSLGVICWDIPFARSPYSLKNIRAFFRLRALMMTLHFNLIHVHTPVAAFLGRILAIITGQGKTLYTAHGFHFYQGAPLLNWLVYYSMEKLLSRYTDALIVINDEDWGIAKSRFNAKRLYHVPGVGVDLTRFEVPATSKEEMRHLLNIPLDAFVLVSVGELNINKNHEAAIRSIAHLGDEAARVYYVICGQGKREGHLRQLAASLGLSSRVLLLGHRTDIPCILYCADVFVMPSLREGLPVSVMEAMAAKLPVVASNIRGNRDLILERAGGLLVAPKDIEGMAQALRTFMRDEELRLMMGEFNSGYVKDFSLDNVLPRMDQIYAEII